ncbi:MAG: FAD-dependent monooxygenase, partial [Pseudomonadota bacterium]
SPLVLNFTGTPSHDAVHDPQQLHTKPMGYIIENRYLRYALIAQATAHPHIDLYDNQVIASYQQEAARVYVTLADQTNIDAPIMIACDGKFSELRTASGVVVTQGNYKQAAIVCTVQCARDHHGWAVELFLPSGPFAMLPMTEGRMNIVWTERKPLADMYQRLDDRQFLGALLERFGSWLGDVSIVGPRFSYPLSYHHAQEYYKARTVFVGDCAHSIHPIAGQGLNLGFRDVAALCDAVVNARNNGHDLAQSFGTYARMRMPDNQMLLGVTHNLNHLFSNDLEPIRLARDMGLAIVNAVTPVKGVLMRHAMGEFGHLPSLLQE